MPTEAAELLRESAPGFMEAKPPTSVRPSVGEEVELSVRLHNPSYSSAEGISVSLSISAERGVCWRILATAKVQSFPGEDHPRLGPTLIRIGAASPAGSNMSRARRGYWTKKGTLSAPGSPTI
jgi:hypothetical protein